MDSCAFCGSPQNLERHHVFFGARRKASERYGMVVTLCHNCHQGRHGPHQDRGTDLLLKRRYQRVFEAEHGHKSFMTIFGRNYL